MPGTHYLMLRQNGHGRGIPLQVNHSAHENKHNEMFDGVHVVGQFAAASLRLISVPPSKNGAPSRGRNGSCDSAAAAVRWR